MKEFESILQAYHLHRDQGDKVALATVVKVDGSAYRRPGARMLVTEQGALTGAISGGCLEGDALRKAQTVIFQQQSMIATYDTTDEDDQKFGVGLGCNGIIQVLIEPIDFDDPHNPLALLERATQTREISWIVTVFSLESQRSAQVGTLGVFVGGEFYGNPSAIGEAHFKLIYDNATKHIDIQDFNTKKIPDVDGLFTFIEPIRPALRLLLFGAGNDTMPLAKMADLLGWQVFLIDGRKSHATRQRFPSAKRVVVSPADEALLDLDFDPYTVALLMTHNFEYEAVVLEKLQPANLAYIGVLGPKRKTMKLIERLASKGIPVKTDNLFAPMGLDLGAEGAEEIALAILGEIRAVLNGRKPIHLRDKTGPIHE